MDLLVDNISYLLRKCLSYGIRNEQAVVSSLGSRAVGCRLGFLLSTRIYFYFFFVVEVF